MKGFVCFLLGIKGEKPASSRAENWNWDYRQGMPKSPLQIFSRPQHPFVYVVGERCGVWQRNDDVWSNAQ